MELNCRTHEFITPSGYKFSIREQNGADEDILSNPMDVRNLMNLTKFIQAIVVDTDFTPNRRLTVEDADRIPLNDRYCILFQSRIFSLGDEVEFEYDWGQEGGVQTYGQSLSEMLFDNYGEFPTEKELAEKPNAIPYYPEQGKRTDYEVTLSSGKVVKFDLLTGAGERMLVTLPIEKQTRNAALIARNLHLQIDGKWEKVTNQKLKNNRLSFYNTEYYNYTLKDTKLYGTFKKDYLVTNKDVSKIVKVDNLDIYYISKDTLYYFNPLYGEKPLLKYSEWEFNNTNMIFID